MDNALALMVQPTKFANAFNEGREAEQGRQMNALAMQNTRQNMDIRQQEAGRQEAADLMRMIGSVGMHAMGGSIDGQPDAQRWNEGLDFLGQMGLDVDQYRNNPAMARVAVEASISAADRLKMARDEREFEQGLKEFDFRMMDANRNYSLNSQKAVDKSDPYTQREQAAAKLGLTPDDPAYSGFVLTGKMPREDAQPLTPTDKKAILEADEMVQTADAAIPLLTQALELNEKAYEGFGAGTRGWIAGNLGYEGGEATMDFDNLIQKQALDSLKATFGAAPTEGERKILLEIQGSSSQPANVRKGILERALKAVERRKDFYSTRASEMRGGDYYKPKGGDGKAPAAASPQGSSATKVVNGVTYHSDGEGGWYVEE